MKLRRIAAAAAAVSGAMTIGLGTAYAEPAPTPTPDESIQYSVKLEHKTVVTTLEGGTFELTKSSEDVEENDVYSVKDSNGDTILSAPIAFNVGDTVVPVKAEVAEGGAVLELTPERDVAVVEDAPVNSVNVVAQPIASPVENQRATNDFKSQFGLATTIGGFVGTAAGAAIGCVLSLPVCIPGVAAGAGIGGILGSIAVGGPALIVAGIDLLNTLQAPPGTSKWANGGK
ncbi:hypothetical protein [Nocardia sp. CNY236]|uniref:hypothetical protein n=1 Tax=Nocardia sp. CNY236 TaxID=1169152 RepID=UPI000417B46A|nr:hypothetical protein [Nocardia sp. CNY236]